MTFNLANWLAGIYRLSWSNSEVKIGPSSRQVVGGKQELDNCWDGRPWLKCRPELETVNKQEPSENSRSAKIGRCDVD